MNRKSPISFILVFLLLAVTMTATAHAATATAPSGVVNINTADATQLSLLPRVGAKAAQRIIDFRKEHGSFQKTTDLLQVKGFGEKRYQTLSAYVSVDGKTTLNGKVSISRGPRKSAKKPSNTASK